MDNSENQSLSHKKEEFGLGFWKMSVVLGVTALVTYFLDQHFSPEDLAHYILIPIWVGSGLGGAGLVIVDCGVETLKIK